VLGRPPTELDSPLGCNRTEFAQLSVKQHPFEFARFFFEPIMIQPGNYPFSVEISARNCRRSYSGTQNTQINNALLPVMMALSEMSQRRPRIYAEKLASTFLVEGPPNRAPSFRVSPGN